jgi:hypothetical protein
MFERIKRRFRSLNRSEYAEEGGQRVENADAMAANGGFTSANSAMPVGGGMPPNYVHSYDEGRPPH